MANPPSQPVATRSSTARSCLVVVLLLVGYVIGSTILLLLPTAFIGPLFVVGGFLFVVVIGVHYLLWGRWLSKLLAEDAQRQAAASADDAVTEDQAP